MRERKYRGVRALLRRYISSWRNKTSWKVRVYWSAEKPTLLLPRSFTEPERAGETATLPLNPTPSLTNPSKTYTTNVCGALARVESWTVECYRARRGAHSSWRNPSKSRGYLYMYLLQLPELSSRKILPFRSRYIYRYINRTTLRAIDELARIIR